jgi:hypothetical protein
MKYANAKCCVRTLRPTGRPGPLTPALSPEILGAMTEASPPSRPALTDRAAAAKQIRAERAAAALRANLRKRKEQARARDAAQPRIAKDRAD